MRDDKQPIQKKRPGRPALPVDQVRSARLRISAPKEVHDKIARVSSEAIEAAIMALPDILPTVHKQLAMRTFQSVAEKAKRVGGEAVVAAILAIPESSDAVIRDAETKRNVLARYPEARVSKYAGTYSLRLGARTLAKADSEIRLWEEAARTLGAQSVTEDEMG